MKYIAAITFVLAAVLIALWAAQGGHLGTLTETPIETISVDAFGDEVTSITWQEGFEIGLDVTAPGAGGLISVGLGLLLLAGAGRRRLAHVTVAAGTVALIGSAASLVMAF